VAKLIHKDLDVFAFKSKDAFCNWLGKNHEREIGFWLRYYKKGTDVPSVDHSDAVDIALCWGWIDGLINKYDEQSYLVRYTPRRPKSVWSKVNVAEVERLIESGLMQPCGLAHVEAAKADGRWQAAYAGQATIDLPKEFLQQIKSEPEVKAFLKRSPRQTATQLRFVLPRALAMRNKQRQWPKCSTCFARKNRFIPMIQRT